jgi:hypothetical protein
MVGIKFLFTLMDMAIQRKLLRLQGSGLYV